MRRLFKYLGSLWSRPSPSPARRLRHLYAIEALPSGESHRGYAYRYYCMRCRMLFAVDRQGGVIALDDRGQVLPVGEGEPRARTFWRGPCEIPADTGPVDNDKRAARVTQIHRRRRIRTRNCA